MPRDVPGRRAAGAEVARRDRVRQRRRGDERVGGREVASVPRTYVKLGGLGMKMTGFSFCEDEVPAASEDLERIWRAFIVSCINAFGRQRWMFERNLPVGEGMWSCRVVWTRC